MNDIEGEVHIGTHLDAPVHFARNKWSVDQIPPNRFFAPGNFLKITGKYCLCELILYTLQ